MILHSLLFSIRLFRCWTAVWTIIICGDRRSGLYRLPAFFIIACFIVWGFISISGGSLWGLLAAISDGWTTRGFTRLICQCFLGIIHSICLLGYLRATWLYAIKMCMLLFVYLLCSCSFGDWFVILLVIFQGFWYPIRSYLLYLPGYLWYFHVNGFYLNID